MVSFNPVKLSGFLRPNIATVPRAKVRRGNSIGRYVQLN
jgi:hypothetical protein